MPDVRISLEGPVQEERMPKVPEKVVLAAEHVQGDVMIIGCCGILANSAAVAGSSIQLQFGDALRSVPGPAAVRFFTDGIDELRPRARVTFTVGPSSNVFPPLSPSSRQLQQPIRRTRALGNRFHRNARFPV